MNGGMTGERKAGPEAGDPGFQLDLTSGDKPRDPTKFDLLCDNVNTSMVTLNNALQEFFGLKDELLKHSLPPKLLVQVTLVAAKAFRSFSDLCVPVGELTRLARVYSGPWEEKSEPLKKLREDYESMKRQLSIALKKIEMMAAEEERIQHERRLMNWEKLFARVMGAKSHGRRWKFRIEPLRKKLEEGFNPYVSDSSEESEDEEQESRKILSPLDESDDELKDLPSDSEATDSEISRILSTHSGIQTNSSQKRVRFADMGPVGAPPSPEATPPPATPLVETRDATTGTEDPFYDNYLLVQVFRPNGTMPDVDLCCTLSLGEQFISTRVFPCKPDPGNLFKYQDFHFFLSADAARTLPPHPQHPLSPLDVPKLTIAVYPRTIAEEMVAHTSIPLRQLTLTEEPTVLVPPDCSEEPFDLDWEGIAATLQTFPVEYELRPAGKDEGEEATPLIPLVCHRVKVLRHQNMHTGTGTLSWDELLLELGYRLVPDSQSRAVSAIHFEEEGERTPLPQEEIEDQISQEQLAEMTLKHAEEMKKLQQEYEHRLESLSRSLAKVKAEKARQIEELELALVEAEQSKGKKIRSTSEIRTLMATKRKSKVTHGLPEWGKDLPQDFFERLELFAEESVRKQAELAERIKREVSEVCEKQLATQHKLAPGLRTDIDTTTEDVSLPALFMPTPNSKTMNVYTPRAHGYFHPPGSTDPRITQPPTVFKLPALHRRYLPTLNLFELSQHFAQSGPQWLREHPHLSPRYTPAPPPSACGFYAQDLPSSPIQR